MFVFHVTTLFNAYIVAVNQLDAWAYLFAVTLLLAVGVPYLATKEQPVPQRGWKVINDLGDKVPAWGYGWKASARSDREGLGGHR